MIGLEFKIMGVHICTYAFVMYTYIYAFSIGIITILIQPSKVNCFTAKYFNGQLFFSYNSSFLCTPLHGLAVCGFDLFSILAFLITLFPLLHKQPHKILASGRY